MTMTQTPAGDQERPGFGPLLKFWRQRRGVSQLDLALDASVSQRHLSFLESGRAAPSREMVLALARALDVPLREQNTFLAAAGFAPRFRERALDDPSLGLVTTALRRLLDRHEPFPALVMNARHDLLIPNKGAMRMMEMFLSPKALQTWMTKGPINVARMMLDENGLKPYVEDWEALARPLIERMAYEMRQTGDKAGLALVAELTAMPGVPADWRKPRFDSPDLPVITFALRKKDLRVSFLTTLTTLGTPQDITLHELRIECFYPADAETEAAFAGH
jgi:transcriptional regulator with XRE-family HTH domain